MSERKCPECKETYDSDGYGHEYDCIESHGKCTDCLGHCPYCADPNYEADVRETYTYKEARKSRKPFNRKKYVDGWYIVDHRGLDCHETDLSQRHWSEEDLEATDWVVKYEET